jgi:hypothetical protein
MADTAFRSRADRDGQSGKEAKMTVTNRGSLAPSAAVHLRLSGGTDAISTCMSPTHVIEVINDADEVGLINEGVFWTADGSVLISRSSIRDFLAQDIRGQHGWLNTVWMAKLEISMSHKGDIDGRYDNGHGSESVEQAGTECKLCKILMHWVVIPLLAALLAGVCLDVISRYHTPLSGVDNGGLGVPAQAAPRLDPKHR